jgi:hypothetical protein
VTRYEARPRYPIRGGALERGFDALAREVAGRRPTVVAIDGPATLDWAALADGLRAALARTGVRAHFEDARRFLRPRDEVERQTLAGPLRDDPVFAPLFNGELAELLAAAPQVDSREPARDGEVAVLFGPGAALAGHDLLWVADHPKRLALAAVREGRAATLSTDAADPDGERRLTFIDWPVLDRHRRALVGRLDRFLDLSDPDQPRSLAGDALRASLADLAAGPFRTLPTFAPGPWGGQWLRRELGIETDGPNLAWSYELIAPEASILLGDEPALEVGLELALGLAGPALLGAEVDERFGGGFPIRFDYLDTMDGGNLSVHCHPRPRYMSEVFGWQYTQHESYYVMAATPGSHIYLGLRDGIDTAEFGRRATASLDDAEPLDIERFVQVHPAEPHRLYLIPAGTPHASSTGNVVLEISATPYLYSLRFYDWLREDLAGELRPVQLDHAFANLAYERQGVRVRQELIQDPREVRQGDGFIEHEIGRHEELFFVVRRLDIEPGAAADDDTAGRFHVLNLVEGEAAEVETADGRRHPLSYAETIVVPASVGRYRIRAAGGGRVVKAFVAPDD